MNSLVVLFSVLALAAAKPSGLFEAPLLTAYAPVAYAAPAAVSHQSRIDVKSSPAIVASTAYAAPISYAAPAAIAAPVAYAAPAAIAAPIAYTAPSAVSHQSRIDIKSSPAIVAETYAAAAPIAYGHAAFAAPAIAAAPAYAAAPALIAPSVPLDTPEVIAARAAHFEAKALAGGHFIHKRSAPFYAPALTTYSYQAPLATYAHAPITTYSSLSYASPFYTKAYGVHSW